MTENEQMNIRNLTYLRAAELMLAKVIPSGKVTTDDLRPVIVGLEEIVSKLSRSLRVRE